MWRLIGGAGLEAWMADTVFLVLACRLSGGRVRVFVPQTCLFVHKRTKSQREATTSAAGWSETLLPFLPFSLGAPLTTLYYKRISRNSLKILIF